MTRRIDWVHRDYRRKVRSGWIQFANLSIVLRAQISISLRNLRYTQPQAGVEWIRIGIGILILVPNTVE